MKTIYLNREGLGGDHAVAGLGDGLGVVGLIVVSCSSIVP